MRLAPSVTVEIAGEERTVCEVTQLPTDANGVALSPGPGWYWTDHPPARLCDSGQAQFTRGAEIPPAAIGTMYCTTTRQTCGE